MNQSLLAIGIFLLVYAVLITEKFHRTVIALLGAAVMILLGILDVEEALTHYIEWHTIALLIGMMILVGVTNQTGIVQYIAVKAAKAARGRPLRILLALALLTAILSAFLDNVTTVLIMVPVTFSLTRILQVNPVSFLISQIITSNIGGTATLIGDPPNIMIGTANQHLTFNAFLFHLAPIAMLILLVTLGLLVAIYRRHFTVEAERMKTLMQMNEREYFQNRALLIKSLAAQTLAVTSGNIPLTAILLLWGSGIASGIIDNIPFVATMIPLIQDLATASGLAVDSPQANTLWWSLALGACLGGNGTLIGASANVIVASLAARAGNSFSYVEFLKIGAPLTLLSLLLATAYIFLRYILFLP